MMNSYKGGVLGEGVCVCVLERKGLKKTSELPVTMGGGDGCTLVTSACSLLTAFVLSSRVLSSCETSVDRSCDSYNKEREGRQPSC